MKYGINQVGVTFETKCWEKDWRIILSAGRLQKIIADNRYDFREKTLYINNVDDLTAVKSAAEELKRQGVITSYIVVADYADEALKFFNIDKASFDGGYYYSIEELVGIYLCKTPYLLHYSGDARPAEPIEWIELAIETLERDDRIKVANLTWNEKYGQAKRDSTTETEQFYIGQGFSDQNYLIRVKDFKQQIYNETHLQGDRYPRYGGNLFEKRVDAWMRNHDYLRATFKHGSYIHQNFQKASTLDRAKQVPRKIRQFMVRYK